MTDAEIALANSWQRTMTRDKLSVCLGLFIQRLKPRVREPEKRWTLVNRWLWKIDNQIHNQCHSHFHSQFPQFELVDHQAQEPDLE